MPVITIASAVITFVLRQYSADLFGGYKMGFETLLVNGALTYLGMAAISKRHIVQTAE